MGYIKIWGQVIARIGAMAGKSKRGVSENIPLTGFNLLDKVVFGLTTKKAETLRGNLTESVVIALTKAVSEDLQSPLAESVTITNV